MPWSCLRRAIARATLICLTAAAPSHAESALRLEWPGIYAIHPAVTYDDKRQRVGDAEIRIEKLPDGNVSLQSVSGFTDGARMELHGVLEPVDDGKYLRPVFQESRSFDSDQRELGHLEIDHAAGFARCYEPGDKQVAEVALPAEDRVANVTLNLLFQPIARGDSEQESFDLFFCGLGIRFVTFWANRAPQPMGGGNEQAVEVRYGPDLGVVTFIATAVAPKLSMWFTPTRPHAWVAHRLPLYGGGPEVFVIRDDVPAALLGSD